MSKEAFVRHGNLMVIDNVGTLIRGSASIGKSELSLALIDRGHKLVSDDAVELKRTGDQLIGSCPKPISGFMQINPIGMINVRKLFDGEVCIDQHRIDIIIALEEPEKITTSNHALKPNESTKAFFAIQLPCFHIPSMVGKPTPLLIETLVRNFKLRLQGYDAYKDLEQQQRKLMQQRS